MAPISQSYYHQTVFQEDDDEFLQLSAAYSNNVQVHHIHAGGKNNLLGSPCASPTMVSDTGRAMWAHHQETLTDHLIDHQQNRVPLKSDLSFPFSMYPERLGISDLAVPDLYSSCCNFNSETQLGPESILHRHNLCDIWGDCSDSDDRLKPLCLALRDMNPVND